MLLVTSLGGSGGDPSASLVRMRFADPGQTPRSVSQLVPRALFQCSVLYILESRATRPGLQMGSSRAMSVCSIGLCPLRTLGGWGTAALRHQPHLEYALPDPCVLQPTCAPSRNYLRSVEPVGPVWTLQGPPLEAVAQGRPRKVVPQRPELLGRRWFFPNRSSAPKEFQCERQRDEAERSPGRTYIQGSVVEGTVSRI